MDTNSIRDVIEARVPYLRAVAEVIELHAARAIDLAVTSTLEWDVPDNPLASNIAAFLAEHRIAVIGSVAVFGHARFDRDMWGSSEFTSWVEEVRDRTNAPNIGDQDYAHLHGHYLQARDVFLTRDGPILHIAKEVQDRWGFSVMTPDCYMEQRELSTR